MENQRYDKGGSAGSKGVQFQVNLLTVFLLNALRRLSGWRLSTEDKRAGKFDDVVLEWPGGAVLLQAKHRENNKKRITADDLMSTTSKNNDFSLPKYFFSYQEIKDKFTLRNVIVCTNAGVNQKAFKYLKPQADSLESMLHSGDDIVFYSFKKENLPELIGKTKIYREQNLEEIDESVITDENVKEYLEHLQLFFDYPPGNDLGSVVEKLLRETRWHGKVSLLEVYCKIMDWFQQKDGEYLNEAYAKAIFSEIRRDKYWQALEGYNVFLRGDSNFQDSKRIYRFVADNARLLQEIRAYRSLRGAEKKVLCIYPDDSVEDRMQLIEAFGLRHYVYLIIVWPELQEEPLVRDVRDKIEEILNKYKYKKVILLTRRDDALFQGIELSSDSIDVPREPPTFRDLLKETQDGLLRKKNVIFQGIAFTLEDLLAPETVEDYNAEILERLVRGEEIKVGSKLGLLDESIRHLYVHRDIIRKGEKRKEDDIFNVREKAILISDSAGTGKTTIVTKLATVIKEKYPHLWVIRIELSHYSKILKGLHRKKRKTISITELLNSRKTTELANPLEKFIFSMNGKVVLMLDGVDEIGPIYTKLIGSLLVDCLKAPNLAKILVTTRPHLTRELEEQLQVKPFALRPFTKRNQLDFLTSYWIHNLELDPAVKEKCEIYAKALISKMSSWTKSNSGEANQLMAAPLQVRMLAEIFQEENGCEEAVDWEGCKEFLTADKPEPKLPKRIDISSLYEMFLEKKRIDFIDKSNPSGIAAAEQALTDQCDECVVYHQTLALEAILERAQCELFTCYKEGSEKVIVYVLKLGIVQEVDDGLHFLHRTFAEFFVARCLVKELQRRNGNAEFQRFLIDEILRSFDFKVIRNFFDGLLKDFVDALPRDIFQNYRSLSYEAEKNQYNFEYLVHDLAAEGCVAILQLLLKCVNFKIIRGKETTIYDLFRRSNKNEKPGLHLSGNRLDILRFLVRRGGVNIRDHMRQTPLHSAAREGQLEMVRFLVERGSDINVADRERCTPLYEAARGGHFDVVKFLVEQGAVVKVKLKQRGNELHAALSRNHADIVEYLLERMLEKEFDCLDANYSMIPYAAAYLGRLDILTTLVGRGLDVNCRITNGKSLIFGAAAGGKLETVEYLVQQDADINCKDEHNNTLLHAVAKRPSCTCIAKFLVKAGIIVDVEDVDGMTALHRAAEAGVLDTVELLLNNDANVNNRDKKHNRTVLSTAARNGHVEIVELLAERGADINVKDIRDSTVLHLFAQRGRLDAIKRLEKFNLDVTVKDNNGRTALQVAVLNKHADVVDFLVDRNSDVNSRDSDDRTALHLAFSAGTGQNVLQINHKDVVVDVEPHDGNVDHNSVHSVILSQLDIVGKLVEGGANVNATNGTGRTVLHVAILRFTLDFERYPFMANCDRCSSVVKFLIGRGANVNIENCNGDVVTVLAEEVQGCNKYYSGKSLEDVLQSHVFKLLGSMSLNNKSEERASTDGASLGSTCIAGTSQLTVNMPLSEKEAVSLLKRDNETTNQNPLDVPKQQSYYE